MGDVELRRYPRGWLQFRLSEHSLGPTGGKSVAGGLNKQLGIQGTTDSASAVVPEFIQAMVVLLLVR